MMTIAQALDEVHGMLTDEILRPRDREALKVLLEAYEESISPVGWDRHPSDVSGRSSDALVLVERPPVRAFPVLRGPR